MSFNEMTNEELDRAVAAIMERFITRDGDEVAVCVDDDNTELILVHDDWRVTWSPSTEAGDFDDVEHWIEQRGWPWRSSYEPLTKLYYYMVHNLELPQIGHAIGRESRTRAGCVALLRALGEERDGKNL